MSEPKDAKKYELKAMEVQYLNIIYRQYQSLVAGFLSFVANERLAYKVSQNTQFQYDLGQSSLMIYEQEPQKEANNGKSGVKAAK